MAQDVVDYRYGTLDFNGIRDRVVTLRCKGFSTDRIAREVGLTANRVGQLLKSEFETRFADREELKRQTAMQLDWLARPMMDKYERDAGTNNPDRRDLEAILKVIERKCRLLGLDEATQVRVEHVDQLSDAELQEQLARYGHTLNLPTVKQLEPPKPPAPAEQIEDAVVVPVTVENTGE